MLIIIQEIQNEADRSFVEELYQKHGSTMLYIAQGILKDQARAEDAVSQAFLKIIDNLQKFHFENCNKTRGLVVIIVRHISYDMLKSEKRRHSVPLEELETEVPAAEDDAPLESIVSAESYHFVMDCLSCLNEHYRDVLRLKLIYEYEDEEIAKMLAISQENVRVRFQRARKALMQEMSRREKGNE
ncbi:RNA polymerase sigma factor [Caproiciproducens sp. CPB-2]|uniref:RNA polymerase sigma factor n=1 Tax=unclassified Caproiciproducens TaxID=2643836 RepID=UPI0023DC9F34|nr:RNA polymerase sigma factor [Caproiciproducens sp. CPB-2]MDF1494430.1 RNA polymerase sigma factor [Caproiciproducens sp. CPB-2]